MVRKKSGENDTKQQKDNAKVDTAPTGSQKRTLLNMARKKNGEIDRQEPKGNAKIDAATTSDISSDDASISRADDEQKTLMNDKETDANELKNDVDVDAAPLSDAPSNAPLDVMLSKIGYNRQTLKEDLRFLCIFLSIFVFVRFFVYDYFIIPSSSMYPTLLIGDMPLVEKWQYGYSKHSIWFSPPLFEGRIMCNRLPERGEVIVFKAPEDNDTNVIKRVIAVPGDKISVTDGIICVNGEKAKLKYIETKTYYDTNQRTYHDLDLFEEKLPLSDAPIHTVAYYGPQKGSLPNHFPEYTVQKGEYFVMGDNRDFSKDSRCGLGRVPVANLMGRAIRKIYSIDNGVKLWEFWLWLQNIRYSRILKEII
ncbi:hypothetical protein FACS189472_10500 [Alphaproteobacteria bacterium]|nr:hypothetical protein FACS189472_10500 [Alphaproteobacteria bacterium]